MWKKSAATRGLKSERFTQAVLVNRDKKETHLAPKVFFGRLANLLFGREMEKAV